MMFLAGRSAVAAAANKLPVTAWPNADARKPAMQMANTVFAEMGTI
jgi:hypothetical protein